MLRASFRAVADPVRDHVCLSCLSHRYGAPSTLRRFHFTPILRSTSGDKPELNNADVPSNPVIEVPTADLEKKAAKSKAKGKKKSAKYPPKKSNSTNEVTEGEPKADDQSKEAKPHQSSTSSRPSRGVAQVRQLLGANVRPGGNGRSKQRPKNNEELVQLHAFVSKTHTGTLSPESVKALDIPTAPVPRLSFGLDRVLFNPGVYQLRDPRSRVYNFDPYLSQIMPVTEFDFNTLKDYITSSKDTALRDVAVEKGKKYLGSSSSMTSVLSHFHYLLSSWRPIDTRTISQGFPDKLRSFTRLLRAPAAMFLHYQDGVYAIDADKEFDSANILMNLGKSMEKLLTMPKEEFERYRRSSDNKISVEEEAAIPESYHYSTVGNFVMRSQLDAYDPRLPGTGMFDLKTRAVVSIRMDARNFQNGLGYEIKGRFGEYESYEREYFDMIRAAFLKYSLQVRVGRMDGIFVAHHNVERIFGFQYISLPEMDQALHGQSNTALGDAEFQLSLQMWQEILDKATERFPKQSLRFHFETRDALVPFMYIFAEPVTQEEIKEIQTRNAADIEAYQESLLNPNPTPKEPITPMEPGENPTPNTAEEPESVVYDSATPPDPTFKGEKEQTAGKELFAMALTTKNWVNNKVVERPMNLTESDEWKLEYELRELSPKQTSRIYKQVQNRRKTSLLVSGEDTQGVVNNIYMRKLRQISRDGRKYRTAENELDEQAGTIIYTEEK